MLIAQITDIHLGFERDDPHEMNRQRLDAAVKMLCAMDPRPDLLLCTGDLTDRGDIDSYRRLKEALAPLPFPFHLVVGNHDLRAPLLETFPETPTDRGFVQYVLDQGPLRIIVIDTLEERRHAGAFGPERAAWLEARLSEAPTKPTLLVMHHPAVITGIDWMTLGPEETWAPRLTAVVARHKQVVSAICGHMHRPIVAPWAGTTLRACPSCAPQVALDLKPMDLDHPDGRPLIQEEPPAFALHWWTPHGLITHYGRVETPEVLLRFDSGFQPVLKHFEEERKQEPKYPNLTGAPAPALPTPANDVHAAAAPAPEIAQSPDHWIEPRNSPSGVLIGAVVLIAELVITWLLKTPLADVIHSFAPDLKDSTLGLVELLLIIPEVLIAWLIGKAVSIRG